jgi:hypothetical protein
MATPSNDDETTSMVDEFIINFLSRNIIPISMNYVTVIVTSLLSSLSTVAASIAAIAPFFSNSHILSFAVGVHQYGHLLPCVLLSKEELTDQ